MDGLGVAGGWRRDGAERKVLAVKSRAGFYAVLGE